MKIYFRKNLHKVLSIMLSLFVLGCANSSKTTEKETSASFKTKIDKSEIPSLPDTIEAKNVVKKNDQPLTIAMVGDIMMGTTYPKNENNLTADDGASLFADASEILRRVDIAGGNLEGCLFDGEGKIKPCYNPKRFFAFKMPERYSKHLVEAGFDFLGVANNHINDFGPEAFEATQRVLQEAGLEYAGVSGKKPTTIIEKDGRRIGFAAFGFNKGMPSIDNYSEIKKIVSDLKDQSDIEVVCFHGGGEGKDFQHVPHRTELGVRGDVEKFAHTAVDAGADVVYGHSPHVPRALELYKDRIIFYSLGNFCTPFRFNLEGVNGLAPLAEVTVNADGTFDEGKIHSFIQSRGVGPRKDGSHRAAKKIQELTKADFPNTPVQISDQGVITRITK